MNHNRIWRLNQQAFNGKVTSWLDANRTRVCNAIREKAPDDAPDNKWWVMLLSLNAVTTILASTCQRLQGLTTLLQQPAAQLSYLRVRLLDSGKVEGPLPPERIQQLVLFSEPGIRALCAVKLADARVFIEGQGQIAINALASLDPDDTDEPIRSIAELYAGLVGGIATIVATISQTNQPSCDKELPPVQNFLRCYHINSLKCGQAPFVISLVDTKVD
ncbi:hypothetical protein PR001_g21979 [Phytophthora rubi]|uniref:Uncharacterized protein n=1 Tax=Phytophthora rubi TaxID=129364 RepID=A0A6A3J2T9_9STRA|nr:hypothetical protein PR001_g21979 [Phytophthora rubi]